MRSARIYNRILRKNFHMHAAWMPLVTEFQLGDYGLFRRGVFVPLGNIREFGVELKTIPGRTAKIDFVSSSASVIQYVGGGEVQVLPGDNDLEAKLQLNFSRSRSFVLKAGEVTSERIENIAEIANKLAAARRRKDGPRWRTRYKVVGEVYRGENVTIISTRERNTGVMFSGTVGALKKFNVGSVDSSLDMTLNKQVDIQLRGESGAVGLSLFRVRVSGLAAVNFADNAAPEQLVDEETGELLAIDGQELWDADEVEDDELDEQDRMRLPPQFGDDSPGQPAS